MKISRIVFACACMAGLLQPAWGQDAAATRFPARGLPEQPSASQRVVADSSVPLAAIVPTTGKLVVSFTIKLVTPVPSGGVLLCSVNASLIDENTTTFQIANEVFEEASAKATIGAGTATCKVTIPYSWNLTNTSKDTVNLQYSLTLASTTATTFTGLSRTSSQFVVPGAGAIKLPANGATTNFSVSATI